MSVLAQALSSSATDTGQSVLAMSESSPVLLVLLRHFGCTFCREALADLAKVRPELESGGARLVLAHTARPEQAAQAIAAAGLAGVPHVSDPDKHLYRALGLKRGTLAQLFGLKCLVRGLRAGVVDGHLVGRLVGDGFQMPGVFLIHRGRVLRSFVHQSAADRPDYCALARA
jgi:peroxiredoxin